ncbi:MAG: hypothetical protein WDZ53_03135, partial [Balneolales bacterium]
MNIHLKNTRLLALPILILLVLASTPGYAQFQDSTITTDQPSFQISNPLENSPRQYVVRNITVEGSLERTSNFIVTTSGLEEGNNITVPGNDLPAAIKALHQTGLFSDVKIIRTGTSGSQIDLVIVVTEQPRLDEYSISGVKRSHRRDLTDLIRLPIGFAV